MRIDVHDSDRLFLFREQIDLADRPEQLTGPGGEAVALRWDKAIDDDGRLVRCPVCGCREMFARRDFPQKLGLIMTAAAGLIAFGLFVRNRAFEAVLLLGGMVVLDGIILLFTNKCLVCYRCRSEFRDVAIADEHKAWDLATGEKYRPTEERG